MIHNENDTSALAPELPVTMRRVGFDPGLVARARSQPGDNLLGVLVREHGRDLTTAELVGIALLLLVAGHETTANMLGLGTFALLSHPRQLAMVRDDQTAVAPAVEELMRWLTVVHTGMPRIATSDVGLADRTIRTPGQPAPPQPRGRAFRQAQPCPRGSCPGPGMVPPFRRPENGGRNPLAHVRHARTTRM
jgi:hypothetical protein